MLTTYQEKFMNIAKIMIPKISAAFLLENYTVRQGLEKFNRYGYTAVPVLDENGRVCGVFTALSFLHMIADKRGKSLGSDYTFEDAEDYIALDFHDSEVYRFVSGSLYVDELKNIFEQTYSGGKRLAMVFVTSNGKEDGKLLGTISPWDVLGK